MKFPKRIVPVSAALALGHALAFALVVGSSPEPGSSEAPTVLADRNASSSVGTQSEVSIAVDRLGSGRLLAAAMNLPDGRLMTMSSDDFGESWRQSLIPLSPGAAIHADPMVAFDSQGSAFLADIPVGPGNTSLGIEVHRSVDSGKSWSSAQRISTATGRDDKVTLAVDDNPDSPYRDAVYVVWKWPSEGIFISRSFDSGESFTRPKLVEVATVSGLDMAVDTNGILYLAFNDQPRASIRVARSTDGGATFAPSVEVAPVRAGWYTDTPSTCKRLALVHASIGVDRSETASQGTLYLTWADYAAGTDVGSCSARGCDGSSACSTNVYFSRSSDGGESWSLPVVVHEREAGITVDQYHEWTEVGRRDGAVYVAYKDTRLDSSRSGTDVYLSRSTDCGLSWESSVRASSATSFATSSDFQYGDYEGLAVSEGVAYPAWADFREPSSSIGESDVYVGRVRFPETVAGWTTRSASADSDLLLLTYRGLTTKPTVADLYLTLGDAEGRIEAYLSLDGPGPERRFFSSHSLSGSFRVDASIPTNALVGYEDGLLTGVLRSAGDQQLLSSTLKLRIQDLLESPPRCRP